MYKSRKSPRFLVSMIGLALSGLLVVTAILMYLNIPSHRNLVASVQHVFNAGSIPITCKTPHHDAGDSTGTITSGGIERTFLVHLPASYGTIPQPLVFSYHGYDMTADTMEHSSSLDRQSDRAGFVLVFPQGVDSPTSWNAGVGAYGPTGDADDVQFTQDLLSYVETNYCVDTHRIYFTGFSLGGGMAYRLACAMSDQIAAVATVSGAYYPLPNGCSPSRPLPVLEMHGEADHLAPYGGNPAKRMVGVQDYLDGWLERDKCEKTSDTFFQQGDVTGTEWTHCAPGVVVRHYKISDGGHNWPRIPGTPYAVDANKVVWEFFNQFSYTSPTPTK